MGQVGTLGPPKGEKVEIDYGVNASPRGRWIAAVSVALLVATLHACAHVRLITVRTSVGNRPSERVLEKNGFAVLAHECSDEGELLVWEHQAQPA